MHVPWWRRAISGWALSVPPSELLESGPHGTGEGWRRGSNLWWVFVLIGALIWRAVTMDLY